jgi:hypothetical protein
MAIFIPGMPCRLCKRAIRSSAEVAGFPPFSANEADELHVFHDAVTHRECYERDPRHAHMEHRLALLFRDPPGVYVCVVCEQRILVPDEHFGIGYLGEHDPRWLRFNFGSAHRACLPKWPLLPELVAFARGELARGAWKGRGIERYCEDLASFIDERG